MTSPNGGASATSASEMPLTRRAPGSIGRPGLTSELKTSTRPFGSARSTAISHTRCPALARKPVVSTSTTASGTSAIGSDGNGAAG